MLRRCLAVLLLLVAGCAEGGEVPAASQTVEGDGFRFAHPAGWEVRDDADRSPERVVEVEGPVDEHELRPVVGVVRSHALTEEATLQDYVDQVTDVAESQQPAREVVAESDLDVPGAEQARRIDATYVLTLSGGEVPMRATEVVALHPDGSAVVLTVTGPRGALGDDVVDAVVSSLELRP